MERGLKNKSVLPLLITQRGLLLFAAIGVLVVIAKWVSAQSVSEMPPFDSVKTYAHLFKEEPHVLGHLSGFQVSVPRNYLQYKRPFMVEYQDDTPWEARNASSPQRSLNSPIHVLTLYAQLPDLKPLIKENYEGWNVSLNDSLPQDWMLVSFTGNENWQMEGEKIDFALNRVLDGQRKRPLPSKRITFKAEPQPIHGLILEKPSPMDDAVQDDDNRHIYYRMDGNRVITLIVCGAGALNAPGGRHTCMHYYSLWPEMAVEGSFQYYPSMLPRWRELEDKAKALLLKFGVSCTPDAPRCPQGFSLNSADIARKGQ